MKSSAFSSVAAPEIAAIDKPAVAASTRSEPRMVFSLKPCQNETCWLRQMDFPHSLRLSILYILLNERI